MVKYSDFTKEQISLISNGCGARKFIKPPEIKEFVASCNQHDLYYMRGGNFRDKVIADVQFLAYLLLDIIKVKSVFKMLRYTFYAGIYFIAVILFGHFSFAYGKQKTKKQIMDKALLW